MNYGARQPRQLLSRGPRAHLPSDERDVVVKRASLFSMVKTRSAPPARAYVMIGKQEGLELQRHAA
jgi:hypothetical protein